MGTSHVPRSAWKKGSSGNPRGRPKGSGGGLSPTKRLSSLLNEKIDTTMLDGARKKVAQIDRVMQQVINMAAEGDKDCIQWILDRLDGPIERQQRIQLEQTHEHAGTVKLDWSAVDELLTRADDPPLELAERDGEFTSEGADKVRKDP